MVLHTQKTKKTKAKARVLTPEEREHAPLLSEVAAAVAAVKRRDAEQSFELGEHLARAKNVLPEKSLGHGSRRIAGSRRASHARTSRSTPICKLSGHGSLLQPSSRRSC